MAVWDEFLSERDKRHLAATGSLQRARVGFGKRPALLLIDNSVSALGREPLPLEESIKAYPGSMGLEGWAAVEQQARLLNLARSLDIPVIHTNFDVAPNSPLNFYEAVRFSRDTRTSGTFPLYSAQGADLSVHEFTPQLKPAANEVVILKKSASAFLGTPLLALLHQLEVDTLLVGGNSTSGCVRATVCDGGCYNFRMIVVEECVYDRTQASHAMSLFDMDQKYGDVRSITEVMSWLEGAEP